MERQVRLKNLLSALDTPKEVLLAVRAAKDLHSAYIAAIENQDFEAAGRYLDTAIAVLEPHEKTVKA